MIDLEAEVKAFDRQIRMHGARLTFFSLLGLALIAVSWVYIDREGDRVDEIRKQRETKYERVMEFCSDNRALCDAGRNSASTDPGDVAEVVEKAIRDRVTPAPANPRSTRSSTTVNYSTDSSDSGSTRTTPPTARPSPAPPTARPTPSPTKPPMLDIPEVEVRKVIPDLPDLTGIAAASK